MYQYEVSERTTPDGEFTRHFRRVYQPSFTLLLDTYQVETATTRSTQREVTVTETDLLKDPELPESERLLTKTSTITSVLSDMETPISINGTLMTGVYELTIYEDNDNQAHRVFWIKPGVGVVRFYDVAFGPNSFDLWLGEE